MPVVFRNVRHDEVVIKNKLLFALLVVTVVGIVVLKIDSDMADNATRVAGTRY